MVPSIFPRVLCNSAQLDAYRPWLRLWRRQGTSGTSRRRTRLARKKQPPWFVWRKRLTSLSLKLLRLAQGANRNLAHWPRGAHASVIRSRTQSVKEAWGRSSRMKPSATRSSTLLGRPGTAQYEQWNDVLANRDDNELDRLVFKSSILSFAGSFFGCMMLYDWTAPVVVVPPFLLSCIFFWCAHLAAMSTPLFFAGNWSLTTQNSHGATINQRNQQLLGWFTADVSLGHITKPDKSYLIWPISMAHILGQCE